MDVAGKESETLWQEIEFVAAYFDDRAICPEMRFCHEKDKHPKNCKTVLIKVRIEIFFWKGRRPKKIVSFFIMLKNGL